MHVALLAGILLITRAVVLSGEAVSFYAVWFIWVGLYAFYFFNRVTAAAYVGLSSILYAATLVNEPASSPVARWLTTVATLVVAGVFIDKLVRGARGSRPTPPPPARPAWRGSPTWPTSSPGSPRASRPALRSAALRPP